MYADIPKWHEQNSQCHDVPWVSSFSCPCPSTAGLRLLTVAIYDPVQKSQLFRLASYRSSTTSTALISHDFSQGVPLWQFNITMENHHGYVMEKLTISMATFNSKLLVYQRDSIKWTIIPLKPMKSH